MALAALPVLVAGADSPLRPQRDVFVRLLRGGVRLHPNYAGEVMLSTAGILIVSHAAGVEATGLYQMALPLLAVVVIDAQSATMVLQGQVSPLGVAAAWSEERRLLPWILLAVIGLGLLSIPVVRVFLPLLVGPEFVPAIPVYEGLLLVLPGVTLAKLMAPQWIGRGWFGAVSAATLMAGFINLGVALWLVPTRGVWGAVTALVVTYVFVALLQVAMVIHCESGRRRGRHS